jgi:hypothetical protein
MPEEDEGWEIISAGNKTDVSVEGRGCSSPVAVLRPESNNVGGSRGIEHLGNKH